MDKCEANIFPNGRVVFYKEKDLDDAIATGKELLIVCNCSSGGFTEVLGGTGCPEKVVKYSDYITEEVFTGEEMLRFHKAIFTEGHMIFDSKSHCATKYSYLEHCFYNGNQKMKVSEKSTALGLYKEEVEALIEIGVLTKKALKYCIDAKSSRNPIRNFVDCCSGG